MKRSHIYALHDPVHGVVSIGVTTAPRQHILRARRLAGDGVRFLELRGLDSFEAAHALREGLTQECGPMDWFPDPTGIGCGWYRTPRIDGVVERLSKAGDAASDPLVWINRPNSDRCVPCRHPVQDGQG